MERGKLSGENKNIYDENIYRYGVECNDGGRKERAHNGKMIDKKREASKIPSPYIYHIAIPFTCVQS